VPDKPTLRQRRLSIEPARPSCRSIVPTRHAQSA